MSQRIRFDSPSMPLLLVLWNILLAFHVATLYVMYSHNFCSVSWIPISFKFNLFCKKTKRRKGFLSLSPFSPGQQEPNRGPSTPLPPSFCMLATQLDRFATPTPRLSLRSPSSAKYYGPILQVAHTRQSALPLPLANSLGPHVRPTPFISLMAKRRHLHFSSTSASAVEAMVAVHFGMKHCHHVSWLLLSSIRPIKPLKPPCLVCWSWSLAAI